MGASTPTVVDGSTSVWSFASHHLICVGHHSYEEPVWLLAKNVKEVTSDHVAHAIEWSTNFAMKPDLWHVYNGWYENDDRSFDLVSEHGFGDRDDVPISLSFWDAIEACRSLPSHAWQPCLACRGEMTQFWVGQIRPVTLEDIRRHPPALSYDGVVAFEIVPAEDVDEVAENLANGCDPYPRRRITRPSTRRIRGWISAPSRPGRQRPWTISLPNCTIDQLLGSVEQQAGAPAGLRNFEGRRAVVSAYPGSNSRLARSK